MPNFSFIANRFQSLPVRVACSQFWARVLLQINSSTTISLCIILTVFSSLQLLPYSLSSQKFGKTSLWNKRCFQSCDFQKFAGKTYLSCKFLGHSRRLGLSWPINLHSRWVFSSLIFPKLRDRKTIDFYFQGCGKVLKLVTFLPLQKTGEIRVRIYHRLR